jgi:Concanavalin A-like lectin/glucanases superfamily
VRTNNSGPSSSVPRRSALFCVLVALALAAAPACADQLELQNGDVITGTIQVMDAEQIVIQTEYGVLEVARDAVLRGEFGIPDGEVTDALVFSFDFNGSVDDTAGLNLATNNGMRFVTDRFGSPAAAIRSDGTGTYLSIAPTGELNSIEQLTLSMWIHLEDLGTTQYLFSKWNRADGETADGKFTLQTGGGNLTAYFVDPAGTYHWLTARSVLQTQVWHAIAVTFAGGRANIYVDGALVASDRFDSTGLFLDTAPLLIMTAQAQTENPYTYYNAIGTIDDLRLYSRALSPGEVLSLADISEIE